MKILDKIPFRTAIIMTIFLGFAPFVPEPHVWQKLKMLVAGDLGKPIDLFDLLFHLAPAMVLLAKVYRHKTGANQSEG
ncbi:RND transporter [Rhodobacterales bacterium 52_120_T64]|nr:RND transporter [Rhodobacterales bacterium 52_120_T64]